MRLAHGRKLRAGRRAGRADGSGRECPARAGKIARREARGRTDGSGRERPARAGKIARREARGDAAVPVRLEPGGCEMRLAHGRKLRAGRRAGRADGKRTGASGAQERGPALRHILFPASPHPLRGKALCGIVYSPETRHAATCAGCAPCRTAASAATRQSPSPCGVRRLRAMSDGGQCSDAPVPLPLRRAPAARHVGFSPSASCRCPHAQAQAFPCAAAKAPHSRALTPPHGQNRTGACHTKFTR